MRSILTRTQKALLILLAILVGQNQASQKVALVLSGGGAQGMAHIGVLKAFEEQGIPIDLIVGSSAGALVGGLYSAGVTVSEMEEMVRDGTIAHLFTGRPKRSDLPIWKRDELYLGNLALGVTNHQIVGSSGLLDDRLIWRELFLLTANADYLAGWDFDSLYVPFRSVASDLRKQEPVVFRSGPLADALRSSMSIPLIYSPIQSDGRMLVDGGIYVKLPVEIAMEEKPDFIIAVSAEDRPNYESEILGLGGMFETLNSRVLASGDSVDVKGWDYFFRVPTGGHHVLAFPAGEALISAGYLAGVEAAKDLIQLFDQHGIQSRSENSRDAHRMALEGKLLRLQLVSNNADFDPEIIRNKLKLPDSLNFDTKSLDHLIDEIYATDIYQGIYPSLDRTGECITLTLQEKPDIQTRGRLEINSTSGFTLFTQTDSPISRFGGLGQINVTLGNESGGFQFAIYPVSYHKAGARLPFSIRPAFDLRTSYHNYNLPGSTPTTDRTLSNELSLHSASIMGWDRQLVLYGGFRRDDAGDILSASSDFEFQNQSEAIKPFIRAIIMEDHISRDLPNVDGWKLGFQREWIWQDGSILTQSHLLTTWGGKMVYGWSGVFKLEYYAGDKNLPIPVLGHIANAEALQEKYYMYMWAEEVLNLSFETSHTIYRDDLLGELKLTHSRFQGPTWLELDQYEDKGLTAADVSLSYLTLVGKLSVGWSFSELEDYKGKSWAQIGIAL